MYTTCSEHVSLSYFGVVDARIRASEKGLPVINNEKKNSENMP